MARGGGAATRQTAPLGCARYGSDRHSREDANGSGRAEEHRRTDSQPLSSGCGCAGCFDATQRAGSREYRTGDGQSAFDAFPTSAVKAVAEGGSSRRQAYGYCRRATGTQEAIGDSIASEQTKYERNTSVAS